MSRSDDALEAKRRRSNTRTVSGALAWRAAQSWDFRLGYGYVGRQIESDTYYNKTRYGIPQLAVTRYW